MFSELAWKNVRRSVRDYGVWFLTIVFGVCLFYTFNALENQTVLRFLAQNPKTNIVESIQSLIGMLSVFVWAVLTLWRLCDPPRYPSEEGSVHAVRSDSRSGSAPYSAGTTAAAAACWQRPIVFYPPCAQLPPALSHIDRSSA